MTIAPTTEALTTEAPTAAAPTIDAPTTEATAEAQQTEAIPRRRVGVVLFEGFELLDVFGPLEVFGMLGDYFEIVLVAERPGAVRSAQGPSSLVDHTFKDAPPLDLILVPGGRGTRAEVHNAAILDYLRGASGSAAITTSVCTGAAILAAAGILDGRRATSNKRAWSWVVEQGAGVEWVPQARWVDDGDVVTSSGVSAGIDMALAIVERLLGAEAAERVADGCEYERHEDPSWDPFAAKNGLV